MRRQHSIVHLCVTRAAHDPGQVRWYVRRIWLHQGASHDRVVAQGSFPSEVGARTTREVVLRVLDEARAQLEEQAE